MGMEITPKGRGMEQRGNGNVDPETAQWEASAKRGSPGDGGSQHLPGDRLPSGCHQTWHPSSVTPGAVSLAPGASALLRHKREGVSPPISDYYWFCSRCNSAFQDRDHALG